MLIERAIERDVVERALAFPVNANRADARHGMPKSQPRESRESKPLYLRAIIKPLVYKRRLSHRKYLSESPELRSSGRLCLESNTVELSNLMGNLV